MSETARREQAFHWRLVAPLLIGSALNPVNSSLIATALVPISSFLEISVGRTAVLVSSLYLAAAIGQPTAGKLSEAFGPRRVFLGGILLVLAGGLVGGLGQSLGQLIIARVLIGIGTSAGYPSAMLMIRRRALDVSLGAPPGGVLGGLQIAGTATAALGLPLGGVLVDAFGWRSVFYANVPIAALAFVLAWAWLPADASLQRMSARDVASRVDATGIALFGAMMASLLIFLDGLPATHWLWLAVAGVTAAALVAWELRARLPFIDVRLLYANGALTRTYIRYALMALCVYTVLYGLTQWVQVARGQSAQAAGLLLLPMTGVSVFVLGPIAKRNLVRGPLVIAALSSALGAVGILLLEASTATIWVIAITLVFGITLATFAAANQTALYRQALPEQIGTAAGLMRTFGYIGSIGSSAIIAVTFRSSVTDSGLHTVAAIMIGASLLALLFTVLDRSLRHRVPAGDDQDREGEAATVVPSQAAPGSSPRPAVGAQRV